MFLPYFMSKIGIFPWAIWVATLRNAICGRVALPNQMIHNIIIINIRLKQSRHHLIGAKWCESHESDSLTCRGGRQQSRQHDAQSRQSRNGPVVSAPHEDICNIIIILGIYPHYERILLSVRELKALTKALII